MINIGLDTGRERHQFHILDASKGTRDTGFLPNTSWAYEAWAGHIESAYGLNVQLAIESCNGEIEALHPYLAAFG